MSKIKRFTDEDFITYKDRYQKRNIADASREYSIRNGINRNVARHIPLIFDGLKPVARRTLLTLYEIPSKKFQKVNKVTGDVMGHYHPHGDSAISDVIGKMGQYWNNNVLYIDPQGNFGNINGEGVGAGRYIECKLSKFAMKCFFEDYKYASLDMKKSYTGEFDEPEYLPAKYPVGLVNPQLSSIGYGTSSNIPPFNFKEVLEAAIKLIDNPDAKIHLIPDFPTGCEVIADNNLSDINKYGIGKVKVRSTINIDYKKNVIEIRSIPLQISTGGIIQAISAIANSNKLSDDIAIRDFKDNTDPENGVHLDIILDKKANPDKTLDFLLKKNIGLQKTYAVQIRFIDDYQEVEYSPKEYLLQWIDFRREVIRSMYNNKYVKLMEEQHMNNIKLFVFNEDNLKTTINICKTSADTEDAINRLIKTYKSINLSSIQARTINNMRFSDFNKKAYNGFLVRKEELIDELKETERVLSNTNNIDDIIKKELKEGIELFGTPRKSKIITSTKKKDNKDIPNNLYLLGISNDGYIKKVDYNKHRHLGLLGNLVSQPTILLKINNKKSILVFDSNGFVTKVPVHGIQESTPDEQGVEIDRYFKVSGSVIGIIEDKYSDVEDLKHILVSKNGYSKIVSAKSFSKINGSKRCISLEENDELVSVLSFLSDTNKDDVIIYTNNGDGIRLHISDIKEASLNAKGLKTIKLNGDESVAGVDIINRKSKLLFCGTSSGKVKVTELKYFPVMNRNSESVAIIKLGSNEQLIRVAAVTPKDVIRVHKKISQPEEIKISDVPNAMRVAKGVKLIKFSKGDVVLNYVVLK